MLYEIQGGANEVAENEAFGPSFAFEVVVLFKVLPVAPSAPGFGCQGWQSTGLARQGASLFLTIMRVELYPYSRIVQGRHPLRFELGSDSRVCGLPLRRKMSSSKGLCSHWRPSCGW